MASSQDERTVFGLEELECVVALHQTEKSMSVCLLIVAIVSGVQGYCHHFDVHSTRVVRNVMSVVNHCCAIWGVAGTIA